jgi:hypothetical protein
MKNLSQVEICDRDGHVIAIAKITKELTEISFLGEVIQDCIPQDIKDVLRDYHIACESGALRCFDDMQQKLHSFELQVVGIPAREAGVRLRDFQLGPDGLFSMDI